MLDLEREIIIITVLLPLRGISIIYNTVLFFLYIIIIVVAIIIIINVIFFFDEAKKPAKLKWCKF